MTEALHIAETETAKRSATGSTARACARCKQTFTPKRADARYCSPACRLSAHRAAKAGGAAPDPALTTKPKKPRPGGHKFRRANPDRPKRQCPPTPVAEKPYFDPRRPSLYTEEIAAEICFRLSHGETLTKICKDDHLPSRSTVLKWVNEDPEFGGRFARARDLQFEHWADDLVDVAAAVREKPEQVPAARLDSENKRWLLARLKPSLYSERIEARLANPDGTPLQQVGSLDLAKAVLAALQAPALPAPEVIDVEALPVSSEPGGELP